MDLGLGTGGTCRAPGTGHAWDTCALEQVTTLLHCEVGDVIYQGEDEAQDWYCVVTGAARTCCLLSGGGRRQIVDFLLPEDVFGFGACDIYQFFTEVISPGTTLARYPQRSAEAIAESDPHAARWIREKAFRAISRLQARTLVLGHTSALARVSHFLLEWMEHCNQPSGATIHLPMSRYDIADYLAIAVETVSRAFTLLRKRRIVAFRSTRRLTICDQRALELASQGNEDL